ncbi:hypothetical protein GCM10022212_34260 [Actimicrobium antarcticum]|uniref:Uncharacterized protein n=1 Tax=Actimicrobium antarcticum TaxID=1051899 RepID=A0ABP7TXH2_9BURK
MDDKIGTIGSTQGVKDRPRPNKKNSGRIKINRPLLSADSIRPDSVDDDVATDGVTDGGPFGPVLLLAPELNPENSPPEPAPSRATLSMGA